MASYGYQPQPDQGAYNAQNNLNFYQSSYSNQPVSGHSTPFQAAYGAAPQGGAYPSNYGSSSSNYGFGAFPGQPGATGQMGTGQGGLRTGWIAAFGTEGYEGEPPLLEELGVNFHHIQTKVKCGLLRIVWSYGLTIMDRLLLCLTLLQESTNTLWTIPIWRVPSSSALCLEHSFCW